MVDGIDTYIADHDPQSQSQVDHPLLVGEWRRYTSRLKQTLLDVEHSTPDAVAILTRP